MKCSDCSTYDPCGPYGYCQDNIDGNWECQCKFWWIGTFCNQQSSSGIQVITLGILSGILIIVFHGLSTYFSTHKKKQHRQEETEKVKQNDLSNPTRIHMAFTDVKESARFSSFFIAILMLIITVTGLIVKWSLLRPIHNELVNKYKRADLLFYERNSICTFIDLEDFNMLTFPVACFFLLIFIIFSKRTSCMKQKLNGHIAPIVPIDFYVHIKRKFAAVVFAIISDELLDIVNQVINGNTPKGEGVIVVYLLRILKVLFIGFRYYPILSAVYIDSILTLACAILYAWFDFSISIVYQGLCQSDFYPSDDNFDETNGTDIARLFEYYGIGQNLIIIQLFTDIPRYLCWSYILVKLPISLINKIVKIRKHTNEDQAKHLHLTREEKILLHSSTIYSVDISYVRNLFRPIHQRITSRLFLAHLIPKFIYQWRDDFRFSSRILCVYSSTFLLLFFMTIQACILVIPYLDELQHSLQQLIDQILTSSDQQNKQSEFPLPNFVCPYVFAILTALIVTIIQLLVLLTNIRRNLFQIFRGDNSEIPKRDKSKYLSYSTGNFHFAGFFIGYLTWGYVLIALFALIIYISIDAFITFGSVKLLEKILKIIIPILLLILFKMYLNKLLARYVFLQYHGDILAINNRRVLMIFLYFNFFLDSFLGFISSIIRIIKSIIGGCLYMSRLDYSPMGRKLETFDAGFSAYCGFIHMEAVHRNPIMLVTASYLYRHMKVKQYMTKNLIMMKNDNKSSKDYSSKAVQKWYLAVLLLRNPSLVFLRKHALSQIENKKLKTLNEINKRQSNIQEKFRRSSLVSEIDL
ncbi:unnamed protein product [Rotaria sp. Silwood1]|nr:unnamed protein product [Rotaria sp. Silwood1]CAF3322619.1 unnamed protein product [Rotaria sp. Silwood1]CAF3338210.1 unnamed protein product [Rotaria sp. Silwood1]